MFFSLANADGLGSVQTVPEYICTVPTKVGAFERGSKLNNIEQFYIFSYFGSSMLVAPRIPIIMWKSFTRLFSNFNYVLIFQSPFQFLSYLAIICHSHIHK